LCAAAFKRMAMKVSELYAPAPVRPAALSVGMVVENVSTNVAWVPILHRLYMVGLMSVGDSRVHAYKASVIDHTRMSTTEAQNLLAPDLSCWRFTGRMLGTADSTEPCLVSEFTDYRWDADRKTALATGDVVRAADGYAYLLAAQAGCPIVRLINLGTGMMMPQVPVGNIFALTRDEAESLLGDLSSWLHEGHISVWGRA